jgi:hypothetical protein
VLPFQKLIFHPYLVGQRPGMSPEGLDTKKQKKNKINNGSSVARGMVP